MKNKVLILLEGGDNESLKESCAFWASVDDEGTLISDIHPDKQQNAPSLCSKYKIDMHEYYPGSEAYSVCESVVTYLRNHAKSGPFMEPAVTRSVYAAGQSQPPPGSTASTAPIITTTTIPPAPSCCHSGRWLIHFIEPTGGGLHPAPARTRYAR